MPREFKFRVWNLVDKEWDNPSILEVWDNSGIFRPMYTVENYVIQQFSGEQTKDSKEVYEGDIVRCQLSNDQEDLQWEIGVIQFIKGSFTFVSKYENENLHDFFVNGKLDFEVIGNIFDNSNLIPE